MTGPPVSSIVSKQTSVTTNWYHLPIALDGLDISATPLIFCGRLNLIRHEVGIPAPAGQARPTRRDRPGEGRTARKIEGTRTARDVSTGGSYRRGLWQRTAIRK